MVAWRGFLVALRPRILGQKPSGEFLKTAHRAVFLTEFHLIGSNPRNLTRKQNRPGNRLTCNNRGSLEGIRTPDLRLERAAS